MLGTFLFIHLQATTEAEHKCGVRKVQRGFVEDLWEESRIYEETEWKSSARRRIMQFESEIYSAVEAGLTSSTGQNIWSVPNTFVYVFREGFTSWGLEITIVTRSLLGGKVPSVRLPDLFRPCQ